MKRREFITLLGGAATAWPLASRAQQPAMPVVGYLSARTRESEAPTLAAFRQGLGAAGYVENKNVAIEYRFADGQFDQLPVMAADLVKRQVALIATATGPAAEAAKAATTAIPIVFAMAGNPIEYGLVASLNRPGSNVTRATNLNLEVAPKRLELLHELIPGATIIGLLVNPTNPRAESILKDLQSPAQTLGLRLRVLHASTEREFDMVFATLAEVRAGALMLVNDPVFYSLGKQLAALGLRNAVPMISPYREFVAAGGLMSYGGSRADEFRLAGIYAGRILNGEKPTDLPVQQATKVELVLNLKTAKALGLTVPITLLGRADEVIE